MRNWIKQAITTTGATGVGTVLSLGTAATDRLAFRDRYATAAELHNQTISDDTGTAINHMVFDGTLTYGTPDTLTITRIHEKITAGVLEVSPAAGLTLSGAGAGGIVALEHPEALLADIARQNSIGHINGYRLSRPTATTVQASTGSAVINGTLIEDSASVTAMTTMAGGVLTLAASTLYHIYLYDNAGTRELRFAPRAAGTDDPIYDAALDYWTGPAGYGAAYRCVGSLKTNAAAEFVAFRFSRVGRRCSLTNFVGADFRFINGATINGSASLAGLHPAYATHIAVKGHVNTTGAANVVRMIMAPTSALATANAGMQWAGYTDSANYPALGPIWADWPGSENIAYYVMAGTSPRVYADYLGWEARL